MEPKGQKPDKGRLWGNILIIVGAVILLLTGVVVAREQLRRRETLARLSTPSATVSSSATVAPTDTETPALSPTALSPTSDLATATSLPPTATISLPTATAALSAATSAPPTATPIPPTATRVPPTATPAATLTPTTAPAPIVRMVAPAIELDTPVVEVGWVVVEQGGVRESVWETASYAAGHHKNSALPGQGGNVVIAGHHNIEGEVFKRVVDLKAGDEVTLLTEGGGQFTYRVTETMILEEASASPEQRRANAQYAEPKAEERLTLITCWPYWTNTHRVVVIAVPRAP